MISSPMIDCRLFYDLNLSPKFNATTGRLAAAVIEYDAKQIFSFSHAEMLSFDKVCLCTVHLTSAQGISVLNLCIYYCKFY